MLADEDKNLVNVPNGVSGPGGEWDSPHPASRTAGENCRHGKPHGPLCISSGEL